VRVCLQVAPTIMRIIEIALTTRSFLRCQMMTKWVLCYRVNASWNELQWQGQMRVQKVQEADLPLVQSIDLSNDDQWLATAFDQGGQGGTAREHIGGSKVIKDPWIACLCSKETKPPEEFGIQTWRANILVMDLLVLFGLDCFGQGRQEQGIFLA